MRFQISHHCTKTVATQKKQSNISTLLCESALTFLKPSALVLTVISIFATGTTTAPATSRSSKSWTSSSKRLVCHQCTRTTRCCILCLITKEKRSLESTLSTAKTKSPITE